MLKKYILFINHASDRLHYFAVVMQIKLVVVVVVIVDRPKCHIKLTIK